MGAGAVEADQGWLGCTVQWSIGADALDLLLHAGDAAHYLELEVTSPQSARILVTARTRRMDVEGPTVFGTGVTFTEDDEGVSCLAHEEGELLTVPRAELLPARCEMPVVALDEPSVADVTAAEGVRAAAVVVALEELGTSRRYRHRLLVDRRRPAHPLVGRVVEAILGDAVLHGATGYPLAQVVELVTATGTPISGTVEVLDTGAELASFQITDWDSGDGADPPPVPVRTGGRADRAAAPPSAPVSVRRRGGAALRPSDDAPIGLRPRDDDTLPEPEGEPRPRPKPTPPTTNGATLGLLVEQRLLTDVKEIVNRALRPLADTTFQFTGGAAVLPWLDAVRRGVLAGRDPHTNTFPPGFDTLGFCLLHDVAPPAPVGGYTGPAVEVADWGTIRGRGWLDRMAMRDANAAVIAGTYPPAAIARLPAEVATALAAAGTAWTMLSNNDKLHLAHALLLETYGSLAVPGLPRRLTFSSDLLVGEITSYTAGFTVPDTLIERLRCENDGISATLNLGGIRLRGRLNRAPGRLYWIVLAASAIVPIFMPGLAWVLPLIGSIASFVALDAAFVSLRVAGLTAEVRVRLVPNAQGLHEPDVEVSLSGRVSSELTSNVPSPLHRIVDFILQVIVDSSSVLLDAVGDVLEKKLRTLWLDYLHGGHPAAMFGLDLPVTVSKVTGDPGDSGSLYLESTFGTVPGYPVPASTVRADARSVVINDAARLPADGPNHYLSLVASQNTVNTLLVSAFQRYRFSPNLRTAGREALRQLAKPPFTPDPSGTIQLRAANPPVVTIPRALPGAADPHGTITVGYALTAENGTDRHTRVLFTADAPIRLVLGSADDAGTAKVSLLSAVTHPLDVLVDLTRLQAAATRLYDVETVRVTVTEEFTNAQGKTVLRTYVDQYDREVDRALTPDEVAAMAPLASMAARLMFGDARAATRTPQRDGVRGDGSPGGQADPNTTLTYTLDGSDPDDLTSPVPVFAGVDLGFVGGLVAHHLGIGGLVTVALDPAQEPLLVPELAVVFYQAQRAPTFD